MKAVHLGLVFLATTAKISLEQAKILKFKEVFSSREAEPLVASDDQKGFKWVTIPTGAPHFGGLWEAGIKSMKLHWSRMVGKQKLTHENIFTFPNLIEAIQN